MEGRRHRQLFAKRFHAAAGARLQRDLGKGPGRREDQQDAALLLGLGGDVKAKCERLLSLHARHQFALRASRSHRDTARGRAGRGVRPPPAPRGRDPRGGAALGPRGAVPGAFRIFTGADGRADAARARRRPIPQDRARQLQHVTRLRAVKTRRKSVSHRPSRRVQRANAFGRADRRRDGIVARRRAESRRRRGGGDDVARGAQPVECVGAAQGHIGVNDVIVSFSPPAGEGTRLSKSVIRAPQSQETRPEGRPMTLLHTGRHFLQIPGPTNIPDRVLRAMDMPGMDHRSAEFAELGFAVVAASQRIFRTKQPVMIYPSSGTGAWEAAIVNTLQPGDKVLMPETGQFAVLWLGIAEKFKLDVDFLPGDWRRGADVEQIEAKLAADARHGIKAVMVVHKETSTGCVPPPLEVRKALDRTKHPALLMVDTISGLAALEYEHDAWGIDVSVGGSQKGLMLPPGLGFNAVSEKALAIAKANPSMRSYWDWQEVIAYNKVGTWPYTPAVNLLYGLKESIAMLEEEGVDNVFARHKRIRAATRTAVKAWGLETQCQDPQAYSPALTGIVMPEGHDADNFRKIVLDNFDMSLGTGLNKLKGKAFRIAHIGHFNELMLMGTLSGVEMGLDLAKVPHRSGGVLAAMEVLKGREVVAMPKSKTVVA